ncbi:MAG: tetratricopeptide repeat protein [Saprospiraceae bacterium]|nr:tetratricopeptide repeat protein [Saprospiraceae bacterium]
MLKAMYPLYIKVALPILILCLSVLPFKGNSQKVDSLENLLTESLPDTQRMDVLIDLTDILQFQDPQKGITYGEEVLGMAEARSDTARWTGVLSRIGACYANLGDINEAELLWRETLALEIARNDSMGIGRQLTNIGTALDTKGDLDSAIHYHSRALEIFTRKESDVYQAIVYNNLAIDYEIKADYTQALKLYLEALERFERIGHKAGVGAVFSNIGNVYTQLQAYEEAIDYLNQSQEIKREVQDIYGIGLNDHNLSTVYQRLGQLDSANVYALQSLELRKRMGDKEGEGQSLLQLGTIKYQLGEYDEALALAEKAHVIAISLDNRFEQGKAALQLGRNYLQLGKNTKAEQFLQEAQRLTADNKERETQLQTFFALYQLYKSRKDRRALGYHERYVALNDSIRNDEQVREITRLELQYEFDREKELLRLEREQKEALLKEQLQRQKLVQNASLGGLGAGVLIIGLLWRGFRQKQQSNQLLASQKQTIERTLEDRETLLKEIHHRVKNNLQVISSLLSLQSRSIEDPVALGAIEEGKNRVKAMALIHQNLYQDENLIGVHLPDYIDKLANNLVHSYRVDQKQIQIVQEIAPISMDADTLIPIALILNELISNSLKYAFQEKDSGQIDVQIAQIEEGLKITVSDNGQGLPPNFQPEQSNSLGFKLIRSFANKMKAKLDVLSQEGTQVSLLLPPVQTV